MKFHKTCVYLLLFTLCLPLSAQELKKVETEQFRLSYMQPWTYTSNGEMGSSFIIKLEKTDVEDPFVENINLMIQDISANDLTLEDYTEISIGQIKEMLENGKILSNETKTKGATDYQEIIFQAKNSGYDLKFLQQYFLKNGKAFVLTFTAEQKDFETWVAGAKKIMLSFYPI